MRQVPRGSEGGSATLEALIIAPVVILLITVAVVLGEIATFHAAVRQAAQAAARAGSLSRDATTAQGNAAATWNWLVATQADPAIPSNNIHCTLPAGTPTIGTGGFGNAPGSPGSVAVDRVAAGGNAADTMFTFRGTCTLEAKWLLGLFGTDITVTETAYSPIDPFRCNGSGAC